MTSKESMHLESPTSQPQQIAGEARAEATRTMLQLLLEAQKLQAVRMRIEAPGKDSSTTKVELFAEGTAEAVSKSELPGEIFGSLWNYMEQRIAAWPESNEEFFVPAPSPTRLLCAPVSAFKLLADCSLQRGSQTRSAAISLEKMRREGRQSVVEMLALQPANREALMYAAKQRSGLLLANSQGKTMGGIDGSHILLALRPGAVFFPDCRHEATAKEALKLSATNFVIAGMSGLDPVETIFQFSSFIGADAALREDLAERLLLSFVHSRVRRSCGACSRSSAVTPSTLERLPDVLRATAKDTYFFGRGCDSCGSSAYRGTVGLDSAVAVTAACKEKLRAGESAQAITAVAYAEGARSLLEDGVQKIYAGQTSFEEVFSVTTQMSAAFVAAAKYSPSAQVHVAGSTDKSFVNGKPKLMIVEDDVHQQQVLKVVFESEGYEVFEAFNGKEALNKLKSQTVDIVVCDLMMPEVDGITFVRYLRATPEIATVPVLMLTAGGDTEDECKLLECGADDYCRKNIRRKVLLSRVSRLLERKSSGKNPLGHLLAD